MLYLDIWKTCQETSEKVSEEVDGVYWLDPDGPTGARDPFPAFCDMNDEADFGVTVRNKSTKTTMHFSPAQFCDLVSRS